MHIVGENLKFLTAEQGGGLNGDPLRGPARDDALVCNRTQADLDQFGDAWQAFTVIHNPNGTLSLQIGPWFVTAERGGGSYVSTDRTVNEAWQQFRPVPYGDYTALCCADGLHFLKIREDEKVDASGSMALLGFTLRPLPAALPELGVAGQFFTSGGSPWTAIECSDFNLLARYAAGEDITTVLEDRQACGFNLLRVWTLFDVGGIGTLRDCPYAQIPAFVAKCAEHGFYVEFTAYVQPELQDPEHWKSLIDAALRSTPHPLLELMNENDQHPIDVASFSQAPAPLLSSHGSNGAEAWGVTPYWSYVTFHTNGASEEQRKVGHNAMEIWSGPTLTNETSRFPDIGMWWWGDVAKLAYDSAAGAALLCAGACFHSVSGKTSVLFTDDERAAAMHWVDGANSVQLAPCQPGDYRHRGDLEGPQDLRVYQRGGEDICIVRIRK